MGDKEILEIYLNSDYKNISETEIFPHETKTLLTSVICFVMSVCLSVRPSVCWSIRMELLWLSLDGLS